MIVRFPGRRGNSCSRWVRCSSRSSRTAIASSACVDSCRAVNESDVVSTQDTAWTLLRAAVALVVELGAPPVGAQQLVGVIEVPRLQHHAGQPRDTADGLVRIE